MKKYILISFILAGALILNSCGSRRAVIDDLASLAVEIEKNGVSYGMDDWEEVLRKYAKIEKKLDNYKYTTEEQKEIGELKGTLLGNSVKSIIVSSKNKIDYVNSILDGGFEGLLNSLLEIGEE